MEFFILFIVAIAISALGFYKFLYFISVGYGFSIAGIGIAMLVLFRNSLTAGTTAAAVLFIVYGMRLGMYLAVREIKSEAYRRTVGMDAIDGTAVMLPVKVITWLACALLYVSQTSPVIFRLMNGKKTDALLVLGVVIMLFGIGLESAADAQKSGAKAKNPDRFCDSGLFKIVRCPNYLGEIIFWTGVFVSGISILEGVLQWICAMAGYACIVYIMFGGARRLEIRQNRNYGDDPEYQEYVKKTPILIPFIPLYSVGKYKFLIG